MSLRRRGYMVEADEEKVQRQFSYRGAIADWRYPINGTPAGQLLRSGKAKLTRANAGRVYLAVKGGKEYRVKAELTKGIKPGFWVDPKMARRGSPI